MVLPCWLAVLLLILGILLLAGGILLILFREVKDETGQVKQSPARLWSGVTLILLGVTSLIIFALFACRPPCTQNLDMNDLYSTFADCGGRTGLSCGEYMGQKRLQYNAGENFFRAVPKYSLKRDPIPSTLGQYRKSEKCFEGKSVYEFETKPV